MLSNAAKFVTENPVIILLGFVFSIIGTVEIVYSSIINLKTKKQKKMMDEKIKHVYEYLQSKADYDDTSNKLTQAKEELESVRKQLEIEIPRERKRAILSEQLKYEEQIIIDANARIQKIKQKLGANAENISKTNMLFQKMRSFILLEETRELVLMLVFIATATYLLGVIIGGSFIKVLSIFSIVVIIFYVINSFKVLRSDKNQKLSCSIVNIAIGLCFLDALFGGNIDGIVWWAVLLILFDFFNKTSDNVLIDTINTRVAFLCIPLFCALLIFQNYELQFILSMVIVQCVTIGGNVVNIIKLIKKK